MGLVYHYTSPEGALGILQNRTLWFTDCEFLNDPAELKYCYELYDQAWIEVCRELEIPEEKIEHEITKHASPYECESIASEAMGANVPARYYALSTCLNGDNPAMWANYASKDGKAGYALAFDTDALVQALEQLAPEASKFGIYTEVLYGPVHYVEKTQIDDIKAIIRKHLIRLGEAKAVGLNELDRIIASEIARANHWGWFGDLVPFIKRPGFDNEKEYRFVLKVTQTDWLSVSKAAGCPYEIADGDRKRQLWIQSAPARALPKAQLRCITVRASRGL